MAQDMGKVRPLPRGRAGWRIDFGRHAEPRFLYSARGARFTSREMADAVLDAIRINVARGATLQTAVDEFAPATSARNSVRVWAGHYLEEQEQRASRLEISPTHLREVLRCGSQEGHWSWWYALSIYDINAASLNRWGSWLAAERGLGEKSRKNVVGYFRSFVSWLHRLERIPAVPPFPEIKVPDYMPTILSDEQQAAVLQAIPWERRGAMLAACHGARPSEIRALDVSDFRLRNGDEPGLEISKAMKGPNSSAPIGSTKTGDAHWIPIDDELCAWIEWRLEQRKQALASKAPAAWASIALFPNPTARTEGKRWLSNSLREEWRRAAASLDIDVRMYEGTKHSSASSWLDQGMELEGVQRMLRHRDSRSTRQYAKLGEPALITGFKRANSARARASQRARKGSLPRL